MTSRTVFLSVADTKITCRFCSQLASLCNGERTLLEIAQKLHLPLLICEKLARRALTNHWIEVKKPPQPQADDLPEFWSNLHLRVTETLGEYGAALLARSAQMVGGEVGAIAMSEIDNYLIALELNVHANARGALVPHLDALRKQFVCRF